MFSRCFQEIKNLNRQHCGFTEHTALNFSEFKLFKGAQIMLHFTLNNKIWCSQENEIYYFMFSFPFDAFNFAQTER